jgi:hypothetical protein
VRLYVLFSKFANLYKVCLTFIHDPLNLVITSQDLSINYIVGTVLKIINRILILLITNLVVCGTAINISH